MTRISGDECDELLRTFERSWFRVEARGSYGIGEELPEFDRFVAGRPRPPDEIGWWKEWLDQVAALAKDGKTISRVRIIPYNGPTVYQQWQIWAEPFVARAGMRIRYLTGSQAHALGVPLGVDWSLLDGERVIIHEFNNVNEVTGWELITDPTDVARYVRWRDLAITHAVSADEIRAA
jgi:hypothetical protein